MVVVAFRVTKARRDADRAATTEILDRVDRLIEDGVLGGESLNAADLQVASSLALCEYRLDLASRMEGRPLAALLDRVLPAG